jgi:hypothetical protein
MSPPGFLNDRPGLDFIGKSSGHEGRSEIGFEGLERRIAKLLHVERREQFLRKPRRHEPVLADEAAGTPGSSQPTLR